MAEEPATQTPETPPDPVATIRDEMKALREGFEQERKAWADERKAYAEQFGQYVAQQRQAAQPAQTNTDDPDKYFDADTSKNVRAIAQREANRIAYSLLGRAQVLQEVGTNSELEKVVQEELRLVAGNPFYEGLSDDHKLALAVAQAKSKVYQKQAEAGRQSNTQTAMQQAAQAQAAGASLPGTHVADGAATKAKTLEEYIKEFSADPDNRSFLKKWSHLDPDSPQGQEELKKAAKANWEGIRFSGTVGQAVEILSGGGR